MARPVLGENIGPSSDACFIWPRSATSSLSAAASWPLATNARPRTKCHAPTRNALAAGGFGSFRISSHLPKRAIAQYGTTRKPAVIGISASALSSIFAATLRADVERHLALPVGRRGEPEEVDVVRVVGHRIHALGPALGDVALVGLDRQLVALHRVGVAADALVDVRRHVDHVPGVGQQRQQRVGGGFGLLRRHRLHQVDVHVQRARMLRMAPHHVLGEGDDLGGAGVRLAVAHPVAPGPQVHHRLDVEHRDVGVVGELRVHGPHGVRVGLVVGVAVFGLARVALRRAPRSAPARAAAAEAASDSAFFTSSSACGSSFGSIIALMLGPSTSAWPQ